MTELQSYAPGVEATLQDVTIFPLIHTAEKIISSKIGDAVYNAIKEMPNDALLKRELKAALCNLVMYRYKVWEVVQKRQVQQLDTYKYELQMMERSYIDNYFAHIDDVVKLLDTADPAIPEWADSPAKKEIEGLLLKDAADFNQAYNIDNSYFFFFISIFLQRKVLDKHIRASLCIDKLTDDRLRRTKAITAQLTVAYALRQFDFTFMPKSVRDSLSDGASRSGKDEQSAVIALSDFLFREALADLDVLIEEANRSDGSTDIGSMTDVNRPCYKHFLMG